MESTKAAQELEEKRNTVDPLGVGGGPGSTPAEDAKPVKLTLEPAPPDPINVLLNKVRGFVLEQDEYWEIISLPKPVRKKICNDLARVMTRHPRFM